MNLHNIKLFVGIFVLFVYVSIGIFGLIQFNHMVETPMINCPYAQNGSSLCENSLEHINDWRQFSNAIFYSLLILSFLILGLSLYFFKSNPITTVVSKPPDIIAATVDPGAGILKTYFLMEFRHHLLY